MEQFVLVPASVYNKIVSVTKQELPKFKAEQPPTYQIDSLKKEVNKKLFCKADSFGRQNFVLSTYQALKFANNNFGWC